MSLNNGTGMALRWFLSQTIRQAADLANRVQKVVRAQRDLLTPPALVAIEQSTAELRRAIDSGDDARILDRARELESVAGQWLRPYPNAKVREHIEVILVALVLAVAIRTFFVQPMAIPTGSMQPTLFGVTHTDLRNEPETAIPSFPARVIHALARGTWFYQVTAEEDGTFERFEDPEAFLGLVKRQRLHFGGRPYTVWFPPEDLAGMAGLEPGDRFQKGEHILRLKVVSGDRLLVDRFTYNFRRPQRGEILIFMTEGIQSLQPDTHYIKRLVGLPGERVRIGDDQHVVIDGERLDASTPRFENLYTFSGPPVEDRYSGHVNVKVAAGSDSAAGHRFSDGEAELVVPPGHYFVLGDNTMNSYDSRYWGTFPREKVVGRHWFVFWPISPRFGWSVR